MNRLFIAILMLIIIFPIYSQVDQLDGSYWNKLSPESKGMLLTGFAQGESGVLWFINECEPLFAKDVAKILYVQITLSDLQKKIDIYYMEKDNAKTPIWLAIYFVLGIAEPVNNVIKEAE